MGRNRVPIFMQVLGTHQNITSRSLDSTSFRSHEDTSACKKSKYSIVVNLCFFLRLLLHPNPSFSYLNNHSLQKVPFASHFFSFKVFEAPSNL